MLHEGGYILRAKVQGFTHLYEFGGLDGSVAVVVLAAGRSRACKAGSAKMGKRVIMRGWIERGWLEKGDYERVDCERVD